MTTYAVSYASIVTGVETEVEGIVNRDEAESILKNDLSLYGVVWECTPGKADSAVCSRPRALCVAK